MAEVDRIMVNELGIPIELMMEHAGVNLARLAVELMVQKQTKFWVVAGSGNNGGGGLVAARRLVGWGHDVTVVLPMGAHRLRTIPLAQLRRLESLRADITESFQTMSETKDSMIIDAFIGYGFEKREDDTTNEVFNTLQESRNVLSLDAPSGLEVSTGEAVSRIRPIATLTLAFAKSGLLNTDPENTGNLYVCDIGVPSSIYRHRLGIDWSSFFDSAELYRLDEAFRRSPVHKTKIGFSSDHGVPFWTV
ncbi:MAG: NAD(P)H-hydrate epimerase [Candidatus Sifarchaeia archaeon]